MTSQEIQEQLAVQTEHIKEKKKLVLEDLSKVEPAVKDAQQGGCNLSFFYDNSLYCMFNIAVSVIIINSIAILLCQI